MIEITEVIIGQSEIESRKIAEENGYSFRVIGKDGVNYIVTCDFDPNRVNVVLTNDIVIESYIG